jgi:hypothetical protein
VEPGKCPHPREPEPYATITYGNIEVRIGLTFMHHLVQCRGWGDPDAMFDQEGDDLMRRVMGEIEARMYKAPTKPYPCDDCGEGDNAIHPRPVEFDGRGEPTKYKWICQRCAGV